MSLQITFRGQARFDISAGRHTVITDQPVEDGGVDAGMSTVDLFVGSLAGCVALFVTRFCVRHRLSTYGLTIDAEWSMAEHPHRVGAITLRLHLPAALSADQRERLLKVAHGCTVHQSLLRPPRVDIVVEAA